MNDKDQVRPYRAKELGTGQETAETLAEVLKHAAERDEKARLKQKPKAPPKWMLPLGVNLGVLAVYLLVAPPDWVVLNPIEPPPAEQRIEDLRTAIYFQAQRVESYRQENGRLPERLEDVGGASTDVQYIVRGTSQYQLVGSVGTETLVYDSTQSLNEWGGSLDLAAKVRGG